MRIQWITGALALSLMACASVNGNAAAVAVADAEVAAKQIAAVNPSEFVDAGEKSNLHAFDISSDGRLLAILYYTWKKSPPYSSSGFWLALWDISSHKLSRSIAVLRDIGAAHDYKAGNHVVFTTDQSHVVVLSQNKVFVVDVTTGAVMPWIPANPDWVPAQVQAVSGTTVAVSYDQKRHGGYYTEFLDASSLKVKGGWPLATIPQSFSPDGKLAVALAVREWNQGGVAGLQLVDTATGAKLKSIAVGFGFEHRSPDEGGAVIARFLDDNRIIVTSDDMIDHTGNHSGYSLEIISTSQNRIIQEIKPPHFVPTGNLVVSHDHSHFAVFSLYASPRAFHFESTNPWDYKEEIFVFARDGSTPEAVIKHANVGLSYTEEMRVSSDGSVVAFAAASESVKVYQIPK